MDIISYSVIVIIVSVLVILLWISTRPTEPKKPKMSMYPNFEMRLPDKSDSATDEEDSES